MELDKDSEQTEVYVIDDSSPVHTGASYEGRVHVLIRGRERRITPGTVLYLISTEIESASVGTVLAGQTSSS